MRKFIVTSVFLAAILVAVLCEHYCAPWNELYFTMSFTAAFFLYWGIEFVIDYCVAVKGYEKRFELYCAQLVNAKNISLEQINAQRKRYFSRFKRSIIAERTMQVCKFLLCFGAVIALIVAMCI